MQAHSPGIADGNFLTIVNVVASPMPSENVLQFRVTRRILLRTSMQGLEGRWTQLDRNASEFAVAASKTSVLDRPSPARVPCAGWRIERCLPIRVLEARLSCSQSLADIIHDGRLPGLRFHHGAVVEVRDDRRLLITIPLDQFVVLVPHDLVVEPQDETDRGPLLTEIGACGPRL